MSSISAIRAQLQKVPLPDQSFDGQTVIVTGSNSGLGLEAARHFVRLGAARVILAVRTITKGEDAKASIECSTNRTNILEVWSLDMLKYESVLSFVDRCKSLDRLDVLVANAGVLKNTYEESEGVEISIKVNVISTFLLILGLFPILRKSKATTGRTPIAVITSSVMHEEAKFVERYEPSIFEALNKDNKALMADRYNTSKLLEIFLVRSIAEAMQKDLDGSEHVVLNTVNPGLCHSELDRKVEGVQKYIMKLAKGLMARPAEVGGGILVHGAATGSSSHGQYLSECRVTQPSKFVRSKEGAAVQNRVHEEMMSILERINPGITKNM